MDVYQYYANLGYKDKPLHTDQPIGDFWPTAANAVKLTTVNGNGKGPKVMGLVTIRHHVPVSGPNGEELMQQQINTFKPVFFSTALSRDLEELHRRVMPFLKITDLYVHLPLRVHNKGNGFVVLDSDRGQLEIMPSWFIQRTRPQAETVIKTNGAVATLSQVPTVFPQYTVTTAGKKGFRFTMPGKISLGEEVYSSVEEMTLSLMASALVRDVVVTNGEREMKVVPKAKPSMLPVVAHGLYMFATELVGDGLQPSLWLPRPDIQKDRLVGQWGEVYKVINPSEEEDAEG